MLDLVLLVAAIVLCLVQAFAPQLMPKIHKGWLGMALFIATFIVVSVDKG